MRHTQQDRRPMTKTKNQAAQRARSYQAERHNSDNDIVDFNRHRYLTALRRDARNGWSRRGYADLLDDATNY